MRKNLVNSKKSSTFARFFCGKRLRVMPLAIELEGFLSCVS